MNAEQARIEENNSQKQRWHLVGTVSERPAMGNGAGGLQRERRCLELLAA